MRDDDEVEQVPAFFPVLKYNSSSFADVLEFLWHQCMQFPNPNYVLVLPTLSMLDVLRGPQSIQKMTSAGSGELPCLVIFRDFMVHCAVPGREIRNLKKGSKKVP